MTALSKMSGRSAAAIFDHAAAKSPARGIFNPDEGEIEQRETFLADQPFMFDAASVAGEVEGDRGETKSGCAAEEEARRQNSAPAFARSKKRQEGRAAHHRKRRPQDEESEGDAGDRKINLAPRQQQGEDREPPGRKKMIGRQNSSVRLLI